MQSENPLTDHGKLFAEKKVSKSVKDRNDSTKAQTETRIVQLLRLVIRLMR